MWKHLRLTVVEARYRAAAACQLPPFKGSLFRGALGQALQSVACHGLGPASCQSCARPALCAYGGLYEAPPPAGVSSTFDAPRPYILSVTDHAGCDYPAGAELLLQLTLVGSARRWLAAVLPALGRLGAQGFGVQRSRWELETLRVEGPPGIWTDLDLLAREAPELTGEQLVAAAPASDRWILRFTTPAQIREKGRPVVQLDAPLLFRRLVRRVGTLVEWYCGGRPGESDFTGLLEAAQAVTLVRRQRILRHWQRYSTRQGRQHPLSGILGELELSEVPESLRPWLIVGQRVHVGKDVSFGLGRYELSLPHPGLNPPELPTSADGSPPAAQHLHTASAIGPPQGDQPPPRRRLQVQPPLRGERAAFRDRPDPCPPMPP